MITRGGWSLRAGGRWRRRRASAGCHGRWRIRRSPSAWTRCWTSRPRRWRTWGSMSTGAAGPGGGPTRRPASTFCSRTAGTPVSLTCPGIRGCWGRWRAAPPMTPRTGWPRHRRPGATPSRSSPLTCAPSTPRRCAGRCRARSWSVDLFHVVQLAVKMTGDVRRRAVREKYGRRGRSGDPEYGLKGLLVRNLEHLRPGAVRQGHGHPGR